jgi:hypothetical protein
MGPDFLCPRSDIWPSMMLNETPGEMLDDGRKHSDHPDHSLGSWRRQNFQGANLLERTTSKNIGAPAGRDHARAALAKRAPDSNSEALTSPP